MPPSTPIDLRSDTVTRPTPAMRRAMAEAEVGDDVLDGDPTTRRLEARVAELLGKEAGLFFPTGTMANQAAIGALAQVGSVVLLDPDAHIVHSEMAGAAANSGVQLWPIAVGQGRPHFDAFDLDLAARLASSHGSSVSVVCVENTHNGAGGKVSSLAELRALRAIADAHGLRMHLDGARLWNASAASGTSLADFASCAHLVMLSFAKGLGCPVGAILVGDADAIARAHAVRKRLGGGMRQSGVLAAAAMYALDTHMERLAEDHANARLFADSVDGAGGATVVSPDTNIVMIDLPTGVSSAAVLARAKDSDVLISAWNQTRVRAVAHLDVDADAIAWAAAVVRSALEVCELEARR
jgi:threonine aldolase